MKLIIYSICIIILIGCTKKGKETKNINLKYFNMEIPCKWKFTEEKGIDSKVYYLMTTVGDTILVDLGKYSASFDDMIPVSSFDSYNELKKNGFPVEKMFFTDTPAADENQGTFHKEYYYYDTINQHVAKLRIPKKFGIGRTSIKFNNLKENESLIITGHNLDSIAQKELVKSFYTIKFKK